MSIQSFLYEKTLQEQPQSQEITLKSIATARNESTTKQENKVIESTDYTVSDLIVIFGND